METKQNMLRIPFETKRKCEALFLVLLSGIVGEITSQTKCIGCLVANITSTTHLYADIIHNNAGDQYTLVSHVYYMYLLGNDTATIGSRFL